MYLPQYHCIPENDMFWGKGFTDWVAVRNALPLYKDHIQPKIPLDNNYYDLSIKENVIWQSKLAVEYGIYGFGVYHYWFNNEKNLLTRPAEIIRDNDSVKVNYFLAWDNANWKRTWSNVEGNAWTPMYDKDTKNSGPAILIPYILGEEQDWKNHYNSVYSHFISPKYIKVDNKPVFIIFNYDDKVKQMCNYWNSLAIKDGFSGMYFIIKSKGIDCSDNLEHVEFKYEPLFSGWSKNSYIRIIENKFRKFLGKEPRLKVFNYDKVWKNIISNAKEHDMKNLYHGCFVDYDDTPRRGLNGTVVKGATPEKFENYLYKLCKISEAQNKEFVFLTAWNEWGEGAFLEPDSRLGYSYLESIKKVTEKL